MDEDLRESLKELEKNLHAIARQIGSTKSTVSGMEGMSRALDDTKKTLDIIIENQKYRYK